MQTIQQTLRLPAYARGFHLITRTIEREFADLQQIRVGILHVFIQHTSASLTINENADPTVRGDFERFFNKTAPENEPYYQHDYEGSDDMPAHLKAAMLGNSVMIPITNGRLNLGTWQGIYLGEHRNDGGRRTLVLTAWGEMMNDER
ncbi:secondary thiamine-phosphate synthase enzyme YjbQ [Spirosoma validum]|uniref:YjbQ family protein n=1 Tax=Spirosoma validum TaxID=2771355 RepID=A0A927B4E7_9BACT|nr:secondary thiamine-phosphate synthase enzyme YjbQ [Spirosoma validum]MBD2755103.1 YjbQ family protein [Spirosoma validum]